MSRLLLTVAYPRCETCGALLVAAWEVEHAPHCKRIQSQPEESTP